MSTEKYPTIIERTGGTPGQPDALGRLRRPTAAEIQAVAQAQLAWMGANTFLGRAVSDPTAFFVPSSHIVGRTATGDLGAISATQLEVMLDLAARLGAKAEANHTHPINEIELLQFVLTHVSRLGHTHGVGDIETPGATEGHTPRVVGGVLALGPPPSGGGGGGIANPLEVELDLAGFALVNGANEVLVYSGGRVSIQGARIPILNEGTSSTGEVWVKEAAAWVHRQLTAAEVAGNPAVAGTTVHDQLFALAEGIDLVRMQSALLDHVHTIDDLEVPAGSQPHWYLGINAANDGFEVKALPAAGGGITSPLTADLDIASSKLVSGATEIIRVSGGSILLGGRAVFPSTIESPSAGQVPVYDEGNNDFRNRLLAGSEITVQGISGGLADGDDVQEVLESLASSVADADLDNTDQLPQGATNKYATTSSVASAGAVMSSDISDDAALGDEAPDEVVSERAIKAYVDTQISGVGGGGGIAKGTAFPSSPADGQLYYRTDLLEQFQYVAAESAWIGTAERTIDHYTDRLPVNDFGTGSGGYIFGTGNAAGFRAPWDLVISTVSVQNVIPDTGTVVIRKAPIGGSVSAAVVVSLVAERGKTLTNQFAQVAADELISVHVSAFQVGVQFATVSVSYRRRFAA